MTLYNKLSSEVSRRPTFEIEPLPFFDELPDSGISFMTMTIEDRIGPEIVLVLFDKTQRVTTLREMHPLKLMLRSGVMSTSHGPVLFLLFFVPNAAAPLQPYFAEFHFANPFNEEQMATLRSLGNQAYWHAILIDGDQRVQTVAEFINIFAIDQTIGDIAERISTIEPSDFALAMQEFRNTHTVEKLLSMTCTRSGKVVPVRYTLEIVPGKSIGPFALGMTNQEINDAMQLLSKEIITLCDLGIHASCLKRGAWSWVTGSDRCEKLEIVVDNNEHEVLLAGQPVNGIERDDAWKLLESLGSPVINGYGCYEVPEQGIDALRWEHSYEEIYCFIVTPPEKPDPARYAKRQRVFSPDDVYNQMLKRKA